MTNRWRFQVSGAALLAVLACAGCATQSSYHFEVAADMRGYAPPEYPGPEYFEGICEAIRDSGPGAFMLIPGDLDPPERTCATLAKTIGPDYVVYPVVGNHELERPEDLPYLRKMNAGGDILPGVVRSGPPGAEETCYSFDYRDVHIAVINQFYDGQIDNTLDGDVSPALLAWLADDLEATTKPYVFVAGHEPHVVAPDMSNGRVRHNGDSLDKYPERNHAFWSLLRQHGVIAYICGHTHNASVARINGLWQIDAGHARGLGDPGAPSTYLRIFVDPGGVRCVVYRDLGAGYETVFEEILR